MRFTDYLLEKLSKANIKKWVISRWQIIINSLPYRPETVVITGEVMDQTYNLSPSERKTLSEALYSDQTFDKISSDTKVIF